MGIVLLSEHYNGLKVFRNEKHSDERGFFMENWKKDELESFGIKDNFVQDNFSFSKKGVIRGMHFQYDKPMGKLIRVIRGKARFVELDIRHDSYTFGNHHSLILSEENNKLLWVPPGFANGFAALSADVEVIYKCTEYWNPEGESAILWNDPALFIDWQIRNPLMSRKDSEAPTLSQWAQRPESKLLSV